MATTEEYCARAKAAVMAYKVPDAKKVAEEAIADPNADLVTVINEGFSAGITEVGKLFDAKKIFLRRIRRRRTWKLRYLFNRGRHSLNRKGYRCNHA